MFANVCNVPASSIPTTVNTETEEHDTEESMSELESEEEIERAGDVTMLVFGKYEPFKCQL